MVAMAAFMAPSATVPTPVTVFTDTASPIQATTMHITTCMASTGPCTGSNIGAGTAVTAVSGIGNPVIGKLRRVSVTTDTGRTWKVFGAVDAAATRPIRSQP